MIELLRKLASMLGLDYSPRDGDDDGRGAVELYEHLLSRIARQTTDARRTLHALRKRAGELRKRIEKLRRTDDETQEEKIRKKEKLRLYREELSEVERMRERVAAMLHRLELRYEECRHNQTILCASRHVLESERLMEEEGLELLEESARRLYHEVELMLEDEELLDDAGRICFKRPGRERNAASKRPAEPTLSDEEFKVLSRRARNANARRKEEDTPAESREGTKKEPPAGS